MDDSGSVDAAQRWLGHVLAEGDLAKAWLLTDERFRRKLVEAWVRTNRKRDALRGHQPEELVGRLARRDPSRHYLWPSFADAQVEQFRKLWSGVEAEGWLWASKPHSVGGFERVLLVDPDREASARGKDEATRALGFVMHHSQERGWLVAEIAEPEVEK